jgi:hypothetical protein
MAKIIVALFQTPAEAEAARQKLLSSGFTIAEVSFVAGGSHGRSAQAAAYLTDAVEVAVEAASLLLPGTGPLVAAGPLAGAISQIGSGHEAVASALVTHGVSEERAAEYAHNIGHGGALVAVHDVAGEAERKALAILEPTGAIRIEQLAAEDSTGREL